MLDRQLRVLEQFLRDPRALVEDATGTDWQTSNGGQQLLLLPLQRITRGNYLLSIKHRRGRRVTIQRTEITIR